MELESVSLERSKKLNEKWVQDQISCYPALLGLGALVVKEKERMQANTGRLDLLLKDPVTFKRYEVEIQFGASDESHIIRTIKCWGTERKRYPQYEHTAVIIAEEFPSRFLNVIQLLKGDMPIIVLIMKAYKVGAQYALTFVKALDEITFGLVGEDETLAEPIDRADWETKSGTKKPLSIADELSEVVGEGEPKVVFKPNLRQIKVQQRALEIDPSSSDLDDDDRELQASLGLRELQAYNKIKEIVMANKIKEIVTAITIKEVVTADKIKEMDDRELQAYNNIKEISQVVNNSPKNGNLVNWMEKFLFIRTRSIKPDNRPLYAYKCRDKEYEQLKTLTISLFQLFKGRWPRPHLEALFCLYAAETWRRSHSGGPWKWETILTKFGKVAPDHTWLHGTIKRGLMWWGRPLLLSQNGNREFLITIACEGGLPLLLLKKEDAHLHRYFRQLLADYHKEKHSPECNLKTLASHCSHLLPPSLHHDIVFSLSGDLIQKVVALQERVADASDPIVALDKQDEHWRDELPLPVEDSTIDLLLKNLVNEAHKLTITERQKIRWRRLLIQKRGEWTVEQLLELPNSIQGVSLQKWSNKAELPPRLRLFLHTSEGIEQIALLTRLRGEGTDAVYRCEELRRNGVRLSGAVMFAGVQIYINDGINDYCLPAHGNQEWGPLPWVFKKGDSQNEFLGEGTVRSREDTIFVLSPIDGSFEKNGEIECIGHAPGLNRILHQVKGSVEWKHTEFGICQFHCASAGANEETYLLEGRRMSGLPEENPPFLGMPNLLAINRDGTSRRIIDNARLEWRPAGVLGADWQQDAEECMGNVWIRCSDSTNAQLLLRKIRVMPKSAIVNINRIGVAKNEFGTIFLTGLGKCNIECTEISGCHFHVNLMMDKFTIDCLADPGLPVTQFNTALSWTNNRFIILHLPFPRQGAAFLRADQPIQAGEKVAISRLASIHAVTQTQAGSKNFHLNVKIKSINELSNNLTLHQTISLDNRGRGQFDLHRIQEQLSSLLALTGDLDAIADIEILDDDGKAMARIEVGLFDLVFKPDYDNNLLSLPFAGNEQLDADCEQRIKIRMMRLWKPNAEPVILEKCEKEISWKVPQNLEAGPWLVLGEDGDWPRFRPVLWRIDGEPEFSESALVRAIQEKDCQIRKGLLGDLVKSLAEDPGHSDWSGFFEYLHLTRRYPASTFDLFGHFVKVPEALVLTLLKSNDEDFDSVWSLAYQLPFSWHLAPVASWQKAALRHFKSMREALSSIELGEELVWQTFQGVRERVTFRQPFFRQICDWLSATIFPDRQLENSELAMARKAPHFISGWIQEEEQKLQSRHDADERYPQGPQVMDWRHRPDYPHNFCYKHLPKPLRSVRCAPFVAAQIALVGADHDDALLFELQKLRNFDKEWFDVVFAFALCIGLASHIEPLQKRD
jgi:hypothetical protein